MQAARRPVEPLVVVPSEEESERRLRAGDVVAGTYEITRVLGEGGMGIVYSARDVVLGRRVAIKAALAPRFNDAIHEEARALAAVASPFFPRVHHLVRSGSTDLLVMELLVGETLSHRLATYYTRGAKMPIPEIVEHLHGIAQALQIAHDAGLTQRDLKPSNVMLTRDRLVLVDFGLVVAEVHADLHRAIAGSVAYIAPEVIRHGVKRGGGPKVDLYALGIVAYELLVGEPPFEGDTPSETLRQHLRAPVPNVGDKRPDAPLELVELVTSLLAKSPDQRPPCADAVAWKLAELRPARP